MPFYVYECASCKFYTEVMQKISDTPLKKCPSCGKSTLKKLISAPVFRLKGGGWYETDFKSDKESKRKRAGAHPPNSKAVESKPEPNPAEKASSNDSGASGVASRSASKSAAGKSAK